MKDASIIEKEIEKDLNINQVKKVGAAVTKK